VVEHLPNKCETLSSILCTDKGKKNYSALRKEGNPSFDGNMDEPADIILSKKSDTER
jgi:hypothetical protein